MRFNHCSISCRLCFLQYKTDVTETVNRLAPLGQIYTISDSSLCYCFGWLTMLFSHLFIASTSRFQNKWGPWYQTHLSGLVGGVNGKQCGGKKELWETVRIDQQCKKEHRYSPLRWNPSHKHTLISTLWLSAYWTTQNLQDIKRHSNQCMVT